jgi:hypothetical protein
MFNTCVQTFYGKGPHRLLRARSRAARGQITISGVANRSKFLCNFYSIYIIYKCGRGPYNTSWRAAGWRTVA